LKGKKRIVGGEQWIVALEKEGSEGVRIGIRKMVMVKLIIQPPPQKNQVQQQEENIKRCKGHLT
jgi:hypothetical protein